MSKKIQGDVVRNYLKRFPKMADRTVARKIFTENKPLWTGESAVYSRVRYYRGTHGKRARAAIATLDHITKPEELNRNFMAEFDGIPAPVSEYINPWGPFLIVGAYKSLILSDIHIPFHDPIALKAALDSGKRHGCNLIIFNGDTADCHGVSRFEKDPRFRNFPNEIKSIRQFLATVRAAFPNARIIWKDGNHDERYNSYLISKAEELLGLEDYEWSNILQLDKLGIEYVTDKRPIMLGKLPVIHGHEYQSGFVAPVNPARGFFLRAKTHCLGGHHHQTSQHSEKSLDGKVISCWSTGCLAYLHPRYRPLNPYNHGFAEVETATNGDFSAQNYKILDGKIY